MDPVDKRFQPTENIKTSQEKESQFNVKEGREYKTRGSTERLHQGTHQTSTHKTEEIAKKNIQNQTQPGLTKETNELLEKNVKENYLNLPDELLILFTKSLNFEDLINLSFTSKKLNEIYKNPLVAASLLERKLVPDDRKFEFALLAGKYLKELDLAGFQLTKEEFIKMSQACPNLIKLNLSRAIFENSDLEFLPKSLKNLNLSGCKEMNDEGLEHLETLTLLEDLDLSRCTKITDTGLAHLKGLTSLQKLALAGCPQIEGKGFKHLKKLQSLQTLILMWSENMTDKGLFHLKELKSLKVLSLSCQKITDKGLAHLKELPLELLGLGGGNHLTFKGVKSLIKHLPNLKELSIRNCKQIEEESYQGLKKFGINIL